jgi:putative addiction module killer protein
LTELVYYSTERDRTPVREWLECLDPPMRARIVRRLDQVENGHLGDYKHIKDVVYELRFSFSPGYRIYYAKVNDTVLLLLMSGNKDSQQADIVKAIDNWNDWKQRNGYV